MRRSNSASPVETNCTTAERPSSMSASMARISEGHFIEVSRWPKKRCLAPSKALSAADFAFLLSVDSPSTMPVAFKASWMFWWMIFEGAGIGVVYAPLLVRKRVLQDVDLDPVV